MSEHDEVCEHGVAWASYCSKCSGTNPLRVSVKEQPDSYAAQLRSIAQWLETGNPRRLDFAKELREAATALEQLQAERDVAYTLIESRDAVLAHIPECPVHGACLPHYEDWIKARIGLTPAETAELQRLSDNPPEPTPALRKLFAKHKDTPR